MSELFLGAMSFGEQGAGGAPPDECRRMFDLYAEAGGNVVDTASSYRGGQSEAILGGLLEGRRDRFVVATKYTMTRDGSDPNAAGNHRKNLRASLEQSLRRLRTDMIDLYWVHIWDRLTPIEETLRSLDDAVRAGKILYAGISNAPAWLVSRANAIADWRGWTPFCAVQVPYNLLQRDIERELLPMAESLGLTVVVWSPLAHGVLSGKPKPLGPREEAAAQAVLTVARELGVTPAQVALAWTRARSRAIHPILGASSAEQLVDNLGALRVTLPDDAVRRLDEAVEFSVGYPDEFIERTRLGVYGEVSARVDARR